MVMMEKSAPPYNRAPNCNMAPMLFIFSQCSISADIKCPTELWHRVNIFARQGWYICDLSLTLAT